MDLTSNKRLLKYLAPPILILALLLATTGVYPWGPQLMMSLGATPSSQTIPNVSTTSGTVFVQTGWNRLTCSSDVYYLLVAASTDPVTSSTGTLLRGPQGSNGLPKPAWILVSSNQWLALLLRSGTNATCIVETVSMDGSAGSFTTLAVSSTSAFTGQATFSGYISGADAGFNNITVAGTAGVTGQTTLTGYLSGADAGVANLTVGGTAGITGATTITGHTNAADAGFNSITTAGTLANAGDNIVASTKTRGSGALNNASPSIFTATVNTGAICVCANNTTQTVSVKCAVSGTTLTITGPNTTTDTVSYICLQ